MNCSSNAIRCIELLLSTAFFLAITSPLEAGDWPQILGPNRNGEAIGERLSDTWPASGLKTLWKVELGQGYAGPAVVGNRVIVFHRVGNAERVEAIETGTGKQLWQTDFPAPYKGGIDSDRGPRCVPLIHQTSVYVFGAAGNLHALDLATGKMRWSRNAYEDLGGDLGYFGAGATPIVVDDKLLVNIGGSRSGAGIVAFSLSTGKTVWQATDEIASYSSPTLTSVQGKPTAIFVTRLNCVGIDPANGNVLFKFPFGKRGPTVNAATPIVFGDQLFVTASYGVGAKVCQMEKQQATEIWSNDDSLSSQYSTAIHREGFLYGTHGREDIGEADLHCVEARTGKVRWTANGFGVANPILVGDRLLLCKTDGTVVLASASPTKFQAIASASITSSTTRALPAFSNGRLFVRSSAATGTLFCVEVPSIQTP